jgi:PTH2 family peptidyl-tRNA hydrolase
MIDTRIDRDPDPLRLYAIVREDLDMKKGKIAAQAGHAYVEAAMDCFQNDLLRWNDYRFNHGIKICLKSDSEDTLYYIKDLLAERNIPAFIINDLGYTHFEGRETITALGFGPIRQSELPEFVKTLKTF